MELYHRGATQQRPGLMLNRLKLSLALMLNLSAAEQFAMNTQAPEHLTLWHLDSCCLFLKLSNVPFMLSCTIITQEMRGTV